MFVRHWDIAIFPDWWKYWIMIVGKKIYSGCYLIEVCFGPLRFRWWRNPKATWKHWFHYVRLNIGKGIVNEKEFKY